MLKLIKLELRKVKIWTYIKGAVLTCLCIFAFLSLMVYIEKQEGAAAFKNYSMVMELINDIVRNVFIVFASVPLARYVIDEYRNNTISVLFMYPVSRKKLMTAKLIIVSSFTFIAIIMSNIAINIGFYFMNELVNVVPDALSMDMAAKQLLSTATSAAAAACVSLIPLYFGMKKKSAPATIISSVVLVILLGSNYGGFTTQSLIVIPAIFTLAGCTIAYLPIRNIDRVDLV